MKKPTQKRVRRGGFTLIEVLLVLAILGVIAAMVVPNLLGQQQTANIKAAKQSIESVEKAVDLYRIDHNGEFPQTMDDLTLPDTSGAVTKPAYLKAVPLDPWKMAIQYQPPQDGETPIITSGGPDKQIGSQDDITNIDEDQNNQQL